MVAFAGGSAGGGATSARSGRLDFGDHQLLGAASAPARSRKHLQIARLRVQPSIDATLPREPVDAARIENLASEHQERVNELISAVSRAASKKAR